MVGMLSEDAINSSEESNRNGRKQQEREEVVSEVTASVPASAENAMERHPASRSLWGLDWLNFSVADVLNGLGPFLAVFLKGARHWGAGDIGMALAVSSIAGALSQVPVGMLVDSTRKKRRLVALAGLLIAGGCLTIAIHPTYSWVIGAQIVIGTASAVLPPALAALCLGLVGRRRLPKQLGRNQGFSHAGAFTSAILIGAGSRVWGYDWIFYLVCIFAVGTVASVFSIRPEDIDHVLARGGEEIQPGSTPKPPISIRELFGNHSLIVFLGSVILFHFGNAAMLPMAGEVIARTHPGLDTVALSACVIVAQVVMMGVAIGVGWALDAGYGRKPIFLLMLAVLPVRGVLFALFTTNPYAVVAIELLDGVAAGLFSVISVVIAADLTRGTGRFNLAQGLVALSVGIGAGLSNLTAGFVVQSFGFPIGFLYLAGIAVCGLMFFATMMPETRAADDSGAVEGLAGVRR
jgi:MFS family permease